MDREAERMAYDAGRSLPRVLWDEDDDPPEIGERHCPFADGDPQKDAWLRGLRDAVESQLPARDRANLIRRINDKVGVEDDVS